MKAFFGDLKVYLTAWFKFLFWRFYRYFSRLESGKSLFAEKLYQGRGKLARPFIHSGMAGVIILGVLITPVVASSFPGLSKDPWQDTPAPSAVLSSVKEEEEAMSTEISDKPRSETIDYLVQTGDTVSGIAQKFDVSIDTLRWANDLTSVAAIKPGQVLKIPPVTGVVHKVKKGDTVYSVAKYYSIDPQGIVDFPFNTFVNDETFELAVGQILIVPDGAKPKEIPWSPGSYIAQRTPDAGTVVASGRFVWPAAGAISQNFRWYHKAIDIANKNMPPVLAADSGKVLVAGWPDNVGYGNRVMIDHGNGFITLYGHLARIFVTAGQTVNRGDQIGQMGSTGRSTGPHLHFEIRTGGGLLNPMDHLK
ncbi:MAG: Murein DD-endopeptidase MepM [Microgenomates group bacterium ADurb.Bin219]|nr:MAG: Murein DD-endopeptidase MepM [Microgenomates group bacterium ADurb.Bin219]HNP89671.1 M23 family metallopeptidase [Candidatus Woesebacteria bacterium]